MIDVSDLIKVADAYGQDAGGLPDKTISYRVFGDSSRLSDLRNGKQITVGRLNQALEWFFSNWPENCTCPDWVGAYLQSSASALAETRVDAQ